MFLDFGETTIKLPFLEQPVIRLQVMTNIDHSSN